VPKLGIALERWPIAGRFVIARGAKTEAVVVVVTLAEGDHAGRGEAVPYARYGETPETVLRALESVRPAIEAGADRRVLAGLLPAGAARNALDCALWDLEARQSGMPVWQRAGLGPPADVVTAFTLSLDAPDAMADAARRGGRPLYKLKLGGPDDVARLAAVRAAAPDARLIVDANEGWTPAILPAMAEACARCGVDLIEQPLPAGDDAVLAGFDSPVALCADESVHTTADLPRLAGRYRAINVKLDKAGGLSEAIALVQAARAMGFEIMIGCMVSTSLAMAPALLLAGQARYVDLDGPLLLAQDRTPGLVYRGSTILAANCSIWG